MVKARGYKWFLIVDTCGHERMGVPQATVDPTHHFDIKLQMVVTSLDLPLTRSMKDEVNHTPKTPLEEHNCWGRLLTLSLLVREDSSYNT